MLLEGGHERPVTALAFGSRHPDLLITASRDAVRCWQCDTCAGKPSGSRNGAALAAELLAGEEPASVCLDAEDRLAAVAVGPVVCLLQATHIYTSHARYSRAISLCAAERDCAR